MGFQIEIQHEINATPAQVRSILLGFSSFNDWCDFIHDPKVIKSQSKSDDPYKLQPGDVISLNFPALDMTVTPEILVNTEEQFRWIGVGGSKFIFTGEHYFKFQSVDDGKKCLLIHGEEFSGIAVGLFKWLKGEDTRRNFLGMSEKIKERAEAL